MRKQPEFILLYLALTDFILLNGLALSLHFYLDYVSPVQATILLVGTNLSWFAAASVFQTYNIRNLLTVGNIFSSMFNASFIYVTGVTFIYCYIWAGPFPRIIYTLFVILNFFILSANRIIYSRFLRKKSRQGYSYKNALIVGAGMEAKRLRAFFESDHAFGIKFMGFLVRDKSDMIEMEESYVKNNNGKIQKSVKNSKLNGFNKEMKFRKTIGSYTKSLKKEVKPDIKGTLGDLSKLIKSGEVDEIYWTLPALEDVRLSEIIDMCEKHMVRFYRIPNFLSMPFRNLDVDLYDGLPVLHYRQEPLEDVANRVIKRSFDLVFSFMVILLILSWLIPLVWIVMKFTMPGPLFFTQERSGKNNKTFKVLKFRSMKVNKDADKIQATKGDERVTKFGAFLRKSNLDEMPQFINVFLGDMTVVGPRPHMLKHTEEYSELINEFMVRHLVKPGITGWAQINGFRGATETVEQMRGRVEHDVWYLENWSFWLDLKIIYRTVKITCRGDDNAY